MLAVLKILGMFLAAAMYELFRSGHCLLALAAVPTLITLWWVTREHARRRTRGSARE